MLWRRLGRALVPPGRGEVCRDSRLRSEKRPKPCARAPVFYVQRQFGNSTPSRTRGADKLCFSAPPPALEIPSFRPPIRQFYRTATCGDFFSGSISCFRSVPAGGCPKAVFPFFLIDPREIDRGRADFALLFKNYDDNFWKRNGSKIEKCCAGGRRKKKKLRIRSLAPLGPSRRQKERDETRGLPRGSRILVLLSPKHA